jgi:hypothetical protein
VDVRKLDINKEDHILAITSAGDNVLHYAVAAGCERIHAVGRCETGLADKRYEPLPGSHPRAKARRYTCSRIHRLLDDLWGGKAPRL